MPEADLALGLQQGETPRNNWRRSVSSFVQPEAEPVADPARICHLAIGRAPRGSAGQFLRHHGTVSQNKQPLKEDLPKLFTLLKENKLKPVIAHRLPLLAVRRSQELQLAGGVAGKIVLLRELGLS
jgi:hypothetical protein